MSLTIKTAEDLAADAEAAQRARDAIAARRFLADTDWMVIRATETGKPMPDDVAAQRAAARKAIAGGPVPTVAEALDALPEWTG